MPLKDLIQNQLNNDDIEKIKTLLADIQRTTAGKMVNLTTEERQKNGSINEQHKLMVNKIYELHISHPQFNSARVDWVEFASDFAIRSSLEKIITQLHSLAEQFEDTKILHDNDNYRQSLDQYSYISYLANQNEPGITTIKEEVAQFFNRTGSGG